MLPLPAHFYEDTLALACELLQKESLTPNDAGCQTLIAQRLQAQGFDCHFLPSGPADAQVSNLWAQYTAKPIDGGQQQAPLLVFAGHTDVVPTGPAEKWSHPPFSPLQKDGQLWARGSSDMKTSLAAMVIATEAFRQQYPNAPLSLAFLLTSDEEGPSLDGTKIVCQWLQSQQKQLDYCIVGEPTASKQTGDTIKNGRRGSLSGRLTVKGLQGHIAYPDLARNPIHQLAPALAELTQIKWDQGNAFFPPTTWQVSNIHAGTGANNVIPHQITLDFNFRFSTESTAESLQQRLTEVLDRHHLEYHIEWALSGLPFLTPRGPLLDLAEKAIQEVTQISPQLSTSGGTSDGRFIAQICPQVIEIGPPNASIHQIDEHIALKDIAPLTAIYFSIMKNLAEHSLAS